MRKIQNPLIIYFVLISCINIVSSFEAVYAGTAKIPIPIPDTYNITLQLPSQKILNTKIAAGITKFDISQKMLFQFKYQLIAKEKKIVFRFKKEKNAINQLSIDFILCRQCNVTVFNMTDFQWHYFWNFSPNQNVPTPQLLLFVNGFRRFQLTGNVTYLIIRTSQMYTVHFMPGDHWNKDDYILYTGINIQKNPCDQCTVLQKFHLNSTYTLDNQNSTGLFYGLKGYSANKFKGQFVQNQNNNISFQFDSEYSQYKKGYQYGIVAASFKISQNFIDSRSPKLIPSNVKSQSSFDKIRWYHIVGLLFTVIIIVNSILAYLVFCDKRFQSDNIPHSKLNEEKMNNSQLQQKQFHLQVIIKNYNFGNNLYYYQIIFIQLIHIHLNIEVDDIIDKNLGDMSAQQKHKKNSNFSSQIDQ